MARHVSKVRGKETAGSKNRNSKNRQFFEGIRNIVFIFHYAVGVTFGLVSEGANHFSVFVILAVGVVHAAAECDVFIKCWTLLTTLE